MKAKLENTTHIEGFIYEIPAKGGISLRVTGPKSKNPGTEFISGDLNIVTDNEGVNVVPVHFSYVTATTAKGSPNATFSTLKNIIDGSVGTVMRDGKENAGMIRIDSAIGLNEFYSDRNGKEELVVAKRNEGGFVHMVTDGLAEDENLRNTFKADMIITNVSIKEADEERNLPEKAIIKGAVFNFRKELLPVEFSAVNPGAISYFTGLDASNANPVFTCVWGRQISENIVKRHVEESAFDGPLVTETKSSHRDWVITGAAREPYVWDDESTITVEELKAAMADREIHLAEVKRNNDEYKASKGQMTGAVAAPAKGTFNF